jgi:hypothetical protein
MALLVLSGALGKMIHEKPETKNLLTLPFNFLGCFHFRGGFRAFEACYWKLY